MTLAVWRSPPRSLSPSIWRPEPSSGQVVVCHGAGPQRAQSELAAPEGAPTANGYPGHGVAPHSPHLPPLLFQSDSSGANRAARRAPTANPYQERDVPAPKTRGCCDVSCLAARRVRSCFSAPESLPLKPSPSLLAACAARVRAPCDPPFIHPTAPHGARQLRRGTSEERDVPAPHARGCCDVRCLAARRHQEARPCEHVDGFRRRRAVVVPDQSSKTGQVSQWMQTQVGMPHDPRVRAQGVNFDDEERGDLKWGGSAGSPQQATLVGSGESVKVAEELN